MRSVSLCAAVMAALAFATAPVFAHDDAYLDTQQAPNGGQLRMAGPLHFELVMAADSTGTSDGALVVYVTDHAGAPLETLGATGVATVLVGKTRSTANLAPAGDNRMQGKSRHALTSDTKVVVSITLAGKAPEQARFTPGAPRLQASRHPDGKHQ